MNLLQRLSNPALWATVAGVFMLVGLSGAVPDFLGANGDLLASFFGSVLALLTALGIVREQKIQRLKVENLAARFGISEAEVSKALNG